MNQHRNDRARQIQAEISAVLLRAWDPIGINGLPEAKDEYETYVGGIYRLLASDASEDELIEHLRRIETTAMGLPVPIGRHRGRWNDRLRAVAIRLQGLHVKL